MDASSLRIMTLDQAEGVNLGGSHAPTPSYPRPREGPPPRRRAPASTPEVPGLQDARPRPRSSGRCCWPPPPASPRCPTPASASATPPPTRRRARPSWPPCPTTPTLQRQLNAALAGHLPKVLRKRLQRLAIDLTLIPYHGKPFRDLDEIYRGQAKRRHQPLPRLRHRLRRPPRAALHRRPDRRDEGRAAQGRRPTPAPAGGPRRASGPGCSCWIAASTAWR